MQFIEFSFIFFSLYRYRPIWNVLIGMGRYAFFHIGTALILFPSVLQVFVANPNKSQPILDILLKNKEKLVEFLSKFHTDRTEDEQFNDEKNYLIKQIKELQPPMPTASS